MGYTHEPASHEDIDAPLGVTKSSLPSLWIVVVCATLVYLGFLEGGASASALCQNETRRIEQATTTLTDCRAYEMVTPPSKESDEPKAIKVGLLEPSLESNPGIRASLTGTRLAWTSEYSFPGSTAPGVDYLSTRGPTGWSSENLIPSQSVENGTGCPLLIGMAGYSSDLSKGVLADGFAQPGSFKGEALSCGHDEPALVPEEPQGFQDLFLRDNDMASYQLVNVTPANAPAPTLAPENNIQYFPAAFLGASNELGHVVFEEELPLTSNAGKGDELYEWTAGSVSLVTILPGGAPVQGRLAGATRNTTFEESSGKFVPYNIADFEHAVSGDGARIFFEAEGNLYVREHAEQPPIEECTTASKACTEQVDTVQGGPDASGDGKFIIASEDGSKVLFTDEHRLTPDSKAEGGKPDLYEYDLSKAPGERLADLTPDAAEPASVLGVSGASDDGSYVYFVAEGVLASAPNSSSATPTAGRPNLYLRHGGETTFIATLDPSNDSCDWMSPECVAYPFLGGISARVSANGGFIGFDSDLSLTGYDNVGATCVPQLASGSADQVNGFAPGACQEVFLYEAQSNTLNCASCDPSGTAPESPAVIRFPAGPSTNTEMRNAYPQRNVSDAGQVFFETKDPLVPLASNGKLNVYGYDKGQPYLISSGTSESDSFFLDATTSGSDVFFATSQSLLRADDDSSYDIYDARSDGGFPEIGSDPSPCLDETRCRGASTPPLTFSVPSSVTFVGAEAVTKAKPAHKASKSLKKKKKKKKKKHPKKRRKPPAKARRGVHGRPAASSGHAHRGGAR